MLLKVLKLIFSYSQICQSWILISDACDKILLDNSSSLIPFPPLSCDKSVGPYPFILNIFSIFRPKTLFKSSITQYERKGSIKKIIQEIFPTLRFCRLVHQTWIMKCWSKLLKSLIFILWNFCSNFWRNFLMKYNLIKLLWSWNSV